jgi:hypothetical protein
MVGQTFHSKFSKEFQSLTLHGMMSFEGGWMIDDDANLVFIPFSSHTTPFVFNVATKSMS